MGIKSVSIKKINRNDEGTFETGAMCEDVKLSEADVREFFEKSRVISYEDLMSLQSEGWLSICGTPGTTVWENGERTHWNISRARTALFYFDAPNCDTEWRYCDTCGNERGYYIEPGEWEKLRPRVKTATIEGSNEFSTKGEPYVASESCQKEFTLTPDDVRDFFDVARPISSIDMGEAHGLEQSECHFRGKAVLQDGQEAEWQINRFRRGSISIPDPNNPRSFFYYCADCQSEKYYAPCDADCVEALSRAEEGYDAPDPETGD
jgi:hypothetical protein